MTLMNTTGNIEIRVSLYGSFYNVEGVPNGAYSYDNGAHTLRKINQGDYREFLQNGLTMPNVNLYQVPLCLHVVGRKGLFEEKNWGIEGIAFNRWKQVFSCNDCSCCRVPKGWEDIHF